VTRVLVVLAVAAALAACGSAQAATRLSVALLPEGSGGPVEHFRLGCDPTRGTVPDPAAACRALRALAHPFSPVPAGTVCAQIALGPQEAVVRGVVHGRRVWARLRLRDSCEIGRWRRVRRIVPGFPATS
jgi:Subtilisin inhibitor-like